MVDLRDLEEIKKHDPNNVYESLDMLPDQCVDIWELSKKVVFLENLKNVKNIVLCAMGGSMYGAYVLRALYHDSLKVPLVSLGDYRLPGFADQNTLVILSSYSGDTEEPLNCVRTALEKKLLLVALTNGGKALDIVRQNNIPAIVFDQKYNPSQQPRFGTGYMALGTIGMFNNLGYISVSDDEVSQAILTIRKNEDQIKGRSIELAQKIHNSIPVIIAAEHLNGNAHIIRNQINETAKSFSAYSELPELNHHLMEGLKNPQNKKLKVLFIGSDLYSYKLRRRYELTKGVIEKNDVSWVEFKPFSNGKLSQVLEVLSFGGYLSFYLAMLYGQDPSVIPWVDYFKKQLSRKS